jgi:hypothetical protein
MGSESTEGPAPLRSTQELNQTFRSRIRVIPVYPLVLLLAFLVNELMETWIPVVGIIRPLLAIGGVAILVQLLIGLVAGPQKAAFVTAAVVMGAFDLQVPIFMCLVAVALRLLSLLRTRVVAPVDWNRLTRTLNFIGVTALAIAVAQALIAGLSLPPAELGTARQPTATEEAPDIYLLLLDAYPRSDTLETTLGYDNTPFIDSMTEMGFDVATEAHSNYNRTIFTLASMLNARHVEELLPNPAQGAVAQYRELATLIRRGSALADARNAGYEIVAVPTAVPAFTPTSADRVLDSDHLTQYEQFMPRNGALRFVFRDAQLAWFRNDHRDRVLATFDRVAALSLERAQRPRLVLAHVMVPHTPVVFGSDGSLANVPECYWDNCRFDRPLSDQFKAGLRDQLMFTNNLVESTVAQITAHSERPPVIVVFSDHGFRHWSSDKAETYRSLFLSYTPDRPGLFSETAAPINIIPRILNGYLNTGLELADEDVWVGLGSANGFFPLRRWSQEPSS